MSRFTGSFGFWVLQRIVGSVLLLVVLCSAVFWVVRLAPGDPLDQVTGEGMTAADRALVRERLGLDAPVGRQYLHWLAGVAHGDWGVSLSQHRPVADILAEAVPSTLLLTLSAYALHLVLALLAAVAMAAWRGTVRARLLNVAGLVLYSLPSFWFGLMAILVLGLHTGWFPLGGMRSPDAAFMGPWASLLDVLRHLVLPVAVLALGSFMGTARFLRASLEEALGQDYILAARARGVPERLILWRHALRNALLPLVTQVGLYLPFLLGGAVVVEVVFAWPGMGRVTVDAIWSRDYPLIMATTALAAVMVVTGSLVADIGYHFLDPRVRLAGRREGA